ncbi:putative Phytocyanin domain, cupredoxin [Helianthus anomalus]
MAFFNHIMVVLTLFVVVLLPTTTIATEYTVVGPFNTIIKLGPKIKILNSYADCIIPPPDQACTSGHDVIALSVAGKAWFICGVGVHCSALNQKLAIDVKA